MSTTTATPHGHSTESPCHCHDEKPAPCTCCGITCFERPNYFCGHLLTDADLSLDQKYVVEKNKLYHRAIDGYGVACGLKITCDHHCHGQVLIHQGFAIDDCGNDLVVCETTRFDVIGTLKKKGMLVVDEPYDDCEPRREQSRCKIKQCFYITICYDESQSNYETPFQSSCTSGPKQCLPTRTKEGYRFDVTDKLPREHSYLKDLEERFKECFEIHCDREIGAIMQGRIDELKKYVCGEDWKEDQCNPCDLFCTLRAWFLNHLKMKPDEFNCGLFEQVQCLTCPEEYEGDDETCRKDYVCEVQAAFRNLLIYMERYQFDCAMGELIFECKQPCEAHCLVLGTVEVVDGKLTRVCNTPRRYLWTPANLVPTLLYTVLTGEFGRVDHEKTHCCPDYSKFLPEHFVAEFEFDKCSRRHVATAPIRTIESIRRLLHEIFDFTDTASVSAVTVRKAGDRAQEVGVTLTGPDQRISSLRPLNARQQIEAQLPIRRGSHMRAYKEGDEIKRVLLDYLFDATPERPVSELISTIYKRVADESSKDETKAKPTEPKDTKKTQKGAQKPEANLPSDR